MIVMKFGGTSVRNADAMLKVAGIVQKARSTNSRILVVLSATSGTTSCLLDLARNAAQELDYTADYERIVAHHYQVADELHIDRSCIDALLAQCSQHLSALSVLGECTDQSLDAIAGYGELLSTTLFAELLRGRGIGCSWADARQCIITDSTFSAATVDVELAQAATSTLMQPLFDHSNIVVTQGFIASSSSGFPTTLGRGGSDYSAALMGSFLHASEIQIWTDVSGVYTCDPKVVSSAQPIDILPFDDVRTLALFGAKVLHPETILPAMTAGIPVRVLNTFQPEHPGTTIKHTSDYRNQLSAIALLQPCMRIHTTDAGKQSLFAVSRVRNAVSFVASTKEGDTVIVHSQDNGVVSSINVALVDHQHQWDAVALICVVGSGTSNMQMASTIATALGEYTSVTFSSLIQPRCMLITVPIEHARAACADLHQLLLLSSSSASDL